MCDNVNKAMGMNVISPLARRGNAPAQLPRNRGTRCSRREANVLVSSLRPEERERKLY